MLVSYIFYKEIVVNYGPGPGPGPWEYFRLILSTLAIII